MTGYDIERYLNIRRARSAEFAPDGTVAFLMNTTGTYQVWTMEGPGEWPTQRTFYEEPVSFVDWSPTRHELVFGMDEGGNERTQLYRLDPGTGRITALTGMPEAKHRWGGWSHDGEQFAFTSNRRDHSVFDVYVQNRDETGDAAQLVHEGDGWLSLDGWSPDDNRLLVTQAYSTFNQDLYVLDLDTGDIDQITPKHTQARFSSPQWGPDGESVYLCTDLNTDTLRLTRLNLDDRDCTTVVDGETWNVGGVTIDHNTGRLAYTRNVDGYTELTLGELTGPTEIESFPAPAIPDGVAAAGSFDADGDRLVIGASSSTVNTNVYVADVTTGDVQRWTYAPTAGIPEDSFVEPELVRYPTFDDREIPAFFSTPDDASENTPVIVDIHGGPESQRRPSFRGFKQYLLSKGYAVFEPNVRGSAGYGKEYSHLDDVENRMDSVADIEAGVSWLHDHPTVDSDRIVAYGASYGGFMVLAALTEYPELWAAGIDVVGIANFVTFLENTGDWRQELREAEYGSLEDDREFLESISPTNNIENIDAPLFVLHGENDPRVPVGEATQIAEEAQKQGVPVRKLIFEDEGHGFSKLDNQIEAYRSVVAFLDEHV